MGNTQESTTSSGSHQFIVIVLLVMIVVAGLVGFWFGQQFVAPPTIDIPIAITSLPDTTPPPTPQVSPSTDDQVMCTMDALECPDGTYVGRTGPNCEFVCPAAE